MNFIMIWSLYLKEAVEKIVANLCDKTEYVIHIRNLKQALNHELVLNKVHNVIRFWIIYSSNHILIWTPM